VQGYEQRYGLDYDQTFAAVIKQASYRTTFALAATYDWEIEQLDVKSAFLHGRIDTEVYVEQPHRFHNGNKVCHLNWSLYRLKQSLRLWYLTISAYLCKNGFSVSEADLGILTNEKGVILVLHID
jgi:ATP-binding cassette subfamily B (MDR/TAP) protein 1